MHNYVLMGYLDESATPEVIYRGRCNKHTVANLSPRTRYKFYLTIETNKLESPPSRLYEVETLAVEVKRSNVRVSPFPDLPAGWVEVSSFNLVWLHGVCRSYQHSSAGIKSQNTATT